MFCVNSKADIRYMNGNFRGGGWFSGYASYLYFTGNYSAVNRITF